MNIGAGVGSEVCISEEIDVGTFVGFAVGLALRAPIGVDVGSAVGAAVGTAVGDAVGASVGIGVGSAKHDYPRYHLTHELGARVDDCSRNKVFPT